MTVTKTPHRAVSNVRLFLPADLTLTAVLDLVCSGTACGQSVRLVIARFRAVETVAIDLPLPLRFERLVCSGSLLLNDVSMIIAPVPH